jgi:hypothetical protein
MDELRAEITKLNGTANLTRCVIGTGHSFTLSIFFVEKESLPQETM